MSARAIDLYQQVQYHTRWMEDMGLLETNDIIYCYIWILPKRLHD